MRVLAFIALVFLSSCASEELTETAVSPDGSMIAKLYVVNLGACCSARAKVMLTYQNANSERVTEQVYESSGSWPYAIEWIDNGNLIVTACDAHKTEMRSSIQTDGYLENYRSLHILSAHAANSTINGKAYCSAS